jgi:hypothetical protein
MYHYQTRTPLSRVIRQKRTVGRQPRSTTSVRLQEYLERFYR